jgi:transcriptional regulator with XRE-family HTH domain
MISPYVRRLRLAAELRTLRTSKGLTHEQLAKRIGQSRAQISRLENGHVADQDDVMRILDALGVDDGRWTQIMTIAREAGERGWWESNKAMGERQALYANLEAGATSIREFQLTFVPGLLQTPEFTKARIDAEKTSGTPTFSPEKAIEARLGRQRMLRRPGGPTYHLVLDELAVQRRTAPEEVLKAQLLHMAATVNSNPKFTIQVLPVMAEIAGYNVPRSAFSIYEFKDELDPNVVAVDNLTEDMLLTDVEPVARYSQLFEQLAEAALSPRQSLDLLIEATRPRRVAAGA